MLTCLLQLDPCQAAGRAPLIGRHAQAKPQGSEDSCTERERFAAQALQALDLRQQLQRVNRLEEDPYDKLVDMDDKVEAAKQLAPVADNRATGSAWPLLPLTQQRFDHFGAVINDKRAA